MTRFHNPKIREGINVTDEHPLKDFAGLLIAVGLIVVISVTTLALAAEWLVKFIPFEVERKLVGEHNPFNSMFSDGKKSAQHDDIEQYLQSLADELSKNLSLPEEINITVHYIENEMVNAYATLGGHITIFSGLLNKIDNENTLSMVLAHEIAHVKHRDPIVSLGRGVTVGLALVSISGFGDSTASQSLVGPIGQLTALTFNRKQEMIADEEALLALQSYYGHVQGADTLFTLFQSEVHSDYHPEIFRTHPLDDKRIDAVHAFQRTNPLPANASVTPLPAHLLKKVDN